MNSWFIRILSNISYFLYNISRKVESWRNRLVAKEINKEINSRSHYV